MFWNLLFGQKYFDFPTHNKANINLYHSYYLQNILSND